MTIPTATQLVAIVTVCVLSLIANNSWAAECDDWQNMHPDWIWCDDFESSASLGQRYDDVGLNGMSVTTNNPFRGSQSLEQRYSPGQVVAGWISKIDNAGFQDHIFMRWYHKFPAGYSRFPPKMARIGHRDRTLASDSVIFVYVWTDEQTDVLTVEARSQLSSQVSNNWFPVQRSNFNFSMHENEWVAIELEVRLDTPGSNDGLYRMWINDELAVENTGIDFRGATTTKLNEIMLDTYWNGGSPGTLSRYFDNYVISTSRIGLLNEVQQRPSPPSNLIREIQ